MAEKRLLIVKNCHFNRVVQQVFGFCAKQSNKLEIILN